MPPQVSVIVRSMARASLAQALSAIARQAHPSVEVVLVAACGPAHPAPDGRCGPFRVRYVASEMPLSRPQAANAGLDAAQGDFVTFVDDDDTIDPDHLSGLVAAASEAGPARIVHCLARAVFRDGTTKLVGRPVALMQLYERSYLHLSTALVPRPLVDAGCRFDPGFAILEDWDFFLALAQRAQFHFVPRQTFVWNADAGDSGAGGGANQDDARFVKYRDLVYAKWRGTAEALIDRVQPVLQAAAGAAQRGAFGDAEAACRSVLTFSQNDPWALNLLAMIQRATGRMQEARRTQELAVDVRPGDADLVYNLALLCRDLGDRGAASRHAAHAVELAPQVAKYRLLASQMGPPDHADEADQTP